MNTAVHDLPTVARPLSGVRWHGELRARSSCVGFGSDETTITLSHEATDPFPGFRALSRRRSTVLPGVTQ
ncbi:MAG: hypothetical protein NXI31_21270 [bacterium]|nr:hypothetical protein [bacterium]